jgi:hypothetical protein
LQSLVTYCLPSDKLVLSGASGMPIHDFSL